MISAQQLESLNPQMQQLLQALLAQHDEQLRAKDALIAQREQEAAFKQSVIDKLTHECLLHSARINGHDPYAYFKDVLERLPTHPASRIEDLLPHRWAPTA